MPASRILGAQPADLFPSDIETVFLNGLMNLSPFFLVGLVVGHDYIHNYVFIDDSLRDHEYTGFYVFADELFKDGGTNLDSYGVWATYELFNTAVYNSINGVYDIPT